MTSPVDPHTNSYSHNNGATSELLDRLAVSELCKGWPVYRDASEWKNFRSLFAEQADVWTTWSGALPIDDFIEISKRGKEAGAFIMHRECGTLVELNQATDRAVGKMKATITQRFTQQPDSTTGSAHEPRGGQLEWDVDCDCVFIFFCLRESKDRPWKTRFVKLFYMKDKIVSIDGTHAPELTAEEVTEMESYPEGYKYLGLMQKRLGYTIHSTLPTPRNEGWHNMYAAMEEWLQGGDVDLF